MFFKRILAILVCGCLLFSVALAADEESSSALAVDDAAVDEEPVPEIGEGFTLQRVIPPEEYDTLDTDVPLDSIVFAAEYTIDSGIETQDSSWNLVFSSSESYYAFQDVANYCVAYYNSGFYVCTSLPPTFAEILTCTPGTYYFSKVKGSSSPATVSTLADYVQRVAAASAGGGFTLSDLQSWGGDSLFANINLILNGLDSVKFGLDSVKSNIDTSNVWLSKISNALGPWNETSFWDISTLRSDGSIVSSSIANSVFEFLSSLSVTTSYLGSKVFDLVSDFSEYRTDFSGYSTDFSDYHTDFNVVLPLYSGALHQAGSTGSVSSSSVSNLSLPALLAAMNDNFLIASSSSSAGYLSATGTNASASSTATLGTMVGSGFKGLAQIFRGNSGSSYALSLIDPADGVSSYSVSTDSLMASLTQGFSSLQYSLGKLQYVYASEDDIQMKKDAEENTNAATDAFLKPDSPGAVSASSISSLGDVSSSVSGLTATGVSPDLAFTQVSDEEVWSFFTQDVANSLDTVPAVMSEVEPQYTDAYGANMAELYSLLGLGDYEYSTAVEDEVDTIWADIVGGE